MAIFKTGGNFKSNTGHFYINFDYKTHLNFGGNFSKKKVRLIVRKIRYEICTPNTFGIGSRVLGGSILLGSQYTMYCVLGWVTKVIGLPLAQQDMHAAWKRLTNYCVVQWGCCNFQFDILTRFRTIRTRNELRLKGY
jgi:hypothetical protein